MGNAVFQNRLLVVGLVRNCAHLIEADVSRLKRILQRFHSVEWLLVESDSSDGSIAVLERLAVSVPGFRFLSLGTLRETMPSRTQRIAHCRNLYLHEIRANPRYAQINIVAMSDFDGLNTLLTEDAIVSCWNRSDWDVCTANQAGPYYDVWALRHSLWSPNDCSEQFRFLRQYGLGEERALQACVYARMLTVAPDSAWIEVDSAFGGFAFYRREALLQGCYHGLQVDGTEICEHVPFHAALRAEGRRIFINPSLINAGRTEHSDEMRLKYSLARLVQRPAKTVLKRWRASWSPVGK